jgi:hypothetical protein
MDYGWATGSRGNFVNSENNVGVPVVNIEYSLGRGRPIMILRGLVG